jgi:hypothetical protein
MISYRESQLIDLINKPTEVLSDGTKIWKNKEGRYHRLNDKPAVEYFDGAKVWYINGKIHRENDKPAFIKPDGTKFWFINGKLHRENNKPAIEWINGRKAWHINDKFIKRNWDKNGIIHNDKFFNIYGNEIKTTTAQLRDMAPFNNSDLSKESPNNNTTENPMPKKLFKIKMDKKRDQKLKRNDLMQRILGLNTLNGMNTPKPINQKEG